jgi:hypothetical protein
MYRERERERESARARALARERERETWKVSGRNIYIPLTASRISH